MSDVKLYSWNSRGMIEQPDGKWVRLDDHNALRAEVERLQGLIDAHNADCDSICHGRAVRGECEAWTSRGKVCCDCPRDCWRIEDARAAGPAGGAT